MSSVITLLTDFGVSSAYVAQMKGAILSVNHDVTLIDITHEITPQNIRQGAFLLATSAPAFPDGTIHVAVVDPGVGSERRILCARIGRHVFVAPDNGLLSLAAEDKPSLVVELTNREFWFGEVSSTFHGRDVMAPVAAHLAKGISPHQLGPICTDWVHGQPSDAKVAADRITGSVLWIDGFGNVITSIRRCDLQKLSGRGPLVVSCREHAINELADHYAQREQGSLIALVGSSEYLELAVVGGDASERIGARLDDAVRVTRHTQR